MFSKARLYLGMAGTKLLVLFLTIMALGLVLRMITLDHGLPWVVGPDEGFEINRALKLAQGEIDLERSGKGGLYYLLFIEYGVYFIYLFLTGKVTGTGDFAIHYVQDPSMFWLLGRATVLVLSMLILLMTYKIGQKFFGVMTGLVAMLLVAVSPAMVQNTHYINVDIPMALLVVFIAYICLDAIEGKRIKPVAWGAILALAVMTKLPAILSIVPMVIAYWHQNNETKIFPKVFNLRILFFCLSFTLVYAIGHPAGVFVYGSKIGAMLGVYVPVYPVDQDAGLISAGSPVNLWLYYYGVLHMGMGLIALLASLAGCLYMLLQQRIHAFVLVSFPLLLYLACASSQSTHLYYERYMVPIYPFLAIFAAYLVQVTTRLIGEIFHQIALARISLLVIACSSLAVQPLLSSIKWTTKFQNVDTRIETLHWVEENIAPQTSILLRGNPIQRQSMTIPIKNLASNYDLLINQMKSDSPIKAKFLEIQKAQANPKQYDLHTFRHFMPVEEIDSYLSRGVSIFIVNLYEFAPEFVNSDKKHSSQVRDSRIRMYRQLQDNTRFEKIYEISPEAENRTGPPIEVYRLRE